MLNLMCCAAILQRKGLTASIVKVWEFFFFFFVNSAGNGLNYFNCQRCGRFSVTLIKVAMF